MSRVTNITCDGSVAKLEHAQCSHFRSMAEVSFLPSANTRKRASASREVLPTIARVFERLVLDQLYTYVNERVDIDRLIFNLG